MSISRDNFQFGEGSFVGTISRHPEFFETPVADQARMLGWAAGCPIVEELIDPTNEQPGRGAEAMVRRYAAINLWSGYIHDVVAKENSGLADELRQTVQRLPEERIGKYEAQTVPETYHDEMTPMTTLSGFALPRTFIAILDARTDQRDGILKATEAVRVAAQYASTQEELVACLAEEAFKLGVALKATLKNVLSVGWLEESGSTISIDRMKETLLTSEFKYLHAAYAWMTDDDKRQNGIA